MITIYVYYLRVTAYKDLRRANDWLAGESLSPVAPAKTPLTQVKVVDTCRDKKNPHYHNCTCVIWPQESTVRHHKSLSTTMLWASEYRKAVDRLNLLNFERTLHKHGFISFRLKSCMTCGQFSGWAGQWI